ncbi:MAG: lipoprotein insertase outer membrane protein LolB [Cellvibrionaceae bacterium]|nr:lipoprotein insertase outer membrane protein LolB [Cellvibrionaceae bacterium]
MKPFIFALCALALGACSNIPSPSHEQPRSEQLAAMDNWRLRGKLGIKSPEQSGSGFIDWRQQGEQLRIKLSGPLGQGTVIIEGSNGQLSLQHSEAAGPQNPVQLLQQHYGWQLPAGELRHWVLGLPAPNSNYQAQWDDKTGLLQSLQQAHWQLHYKRYTRHRTPLPEKLVLERDTVKLTLIIKRWN